MKVALTLSGNLRTFFMPLRENKNLRVCDLIKKNLVEANNSDVFCYTDTNDFWYEDAQVFPDTRKIEIINSNSFRLGEKVIFKSHEESKEIISRELDKLFGNRIRCEIEKPIDITQDEKYKKIMSIQAGGCIPAAMVHQYRKTTKVYELLEQEKTNYDIIFRARFDILAASALSVERLPWYEADIFVPSVKGPVVTDWFAVGKKEAMSKYMTIYNNMGFTADKECYIWECRKCGVCVDYGEKARLASQAPVCSHCHSSNQVFLYELTLAPEYHVYRTLVDNKIKFSNTNWNMYIYRYRELNENLDLALSKLNIKDAKLINYDTNKTQSERSI